MGARPEASFNPGPLRGPAQLRHWIDRKPMQQLLPSDLLEFLANGGELSYEASLIEPGRVRLRAAADLRIGRVYAAAHSPLDPNRNESGVYRIPAISLIESCEHYDPHHLLTYLPFERSFAALDADHARVTVFTGASWADILKAPGQYLNALWQPSPGVPVSRDTAWWERYEFFKDAFE
jgi:hypothetical protein